MIGLILTGGGARGAYQSGVLRALYESFPELDSKVKVITGVSAGAINASYMAAGYHKAAGTAKDLAHLWSYLCTDDIYRSDLFSLGQIGLGFLRDLSAGNFKKKNQSSALVDSSPLKRLLFEHLDLKNLRKLIDEEKRVSLAIPAFNYSNSTNVTWVDTFQDLPSKIHNRRHIYSSPTSIDRVFASASIPILFPSVKIQDHFYGDGSVRNAGIFSPSIALGCNKVLVIGVRHRSDKGTGQIYFGEPTIGRIFGLILNSLFFDLVNMDHERLLKINQVVDDHRSQGSISNTYRKIETLFLHPSVDLGIMAKEFSSSLPISIRFLLGGLGNTSESSELASYMLFEAEYTKELVKIGYEDTLNQREKIQAFLDSETS